MKYDKQLSVIIVNYNVRLFLEQCLLSVRAAAQGLDVEVIVVDNHSTDGSMEYLRPRFPEVIFIENKDNPGFAKANNQALQRCSGRYILLLNPDTVIGEECLRTLCTFMDVHPEAGAAGVKMIDGTGTFLPESKRSFPSPWTSFCKLSGLNRLFPHSELFSRYSLPYLNANEQHRVEVLAGAFLFVKHEVLDKTGLFDESFFMYGEDIDLSYRIVLGGYVNYYLPVRILHYKGESTKHNDMKYIKAFYGAMLIFYRKYYPRSSWFMSFLVKSAVSFKILAASCLGRKDRTSSPPRNKNKSLLIVCNKENVEAVSESCRQNAVWDNLAVVHWSIQEMDEAKENGFCRVCEKEFSDIVFSYPDMSFEQMLFFMDKIPDKKITYHLCHYPNKQLVSPGRK